MSKGLRLLIISPSFGFGGAELATLRLILGLSSKIDVTCLLMHRQNDDSLAIKSLKKAGVKIYFFPLSSDIFRPIRAFFRRINLKKNGTYINLYEAILAKYLLWINEKKQWNVINSHQIRAERIACIALEKSNALLIGSDHGDYRQLYSVDGHLKSDSSKAFTAITNRSNMLICPCLANIPFAQKLPWHPNFQIHRIHYGYNRPLEISGHSKSKTNPFIFGMVARGIAEKGWEEAIRAFQIAKKEIRQKTILQLVGEGPALEALQQKLNFSLEDVEFLGHSNDPSQIIVNFNVGILPSYFHMESLPNSVIEYVMHGIPVIATNHAGISEILETNIGLAGILVNKTHSYGPADIQELAIAMVKIAGSPDLQKELQNRANLAASRFEINAMATNYLEIFTTWLDSKHN